jgi:hypothetical protein
MAGKGPESAPTRPNPTTITHHHNTFPLKRARSPFSIPRGFVALSTNLTNVIVVLRFRVGSLVLKGDTKNL